MVISQVNSWVLIKIKGMVFALRNVNLSWIF